MGLSATVTIWVDDLVAGASCSEPIVTDENVLLVGARTKITQAVIDGLRDRGVETIEVAPCDASKLKSGQSKGLRLPPRTSRANSTSKQKWPAGKPVKEILIDRFDEPLSSDRREMLGEGMKAAKIQIDQVSSSLSENKLRTIDIVSKISDRFANFLVDDHDQTIGDGASGSECLDLVERSVRMAMLGMAVAVEMGLDGLEVCEVGTTGLLHDISLNAMEPKFAIPGAELTEREMWEYRKHPIASQQCLAGVNGVSSHVRIAVEQVHEQLNGSGYPRGFQGRRIHRYARILNVVEAYLQLTLPTCTRPGIVPHDAMGILLHQARHGLFEPLVIRAFLMTETLFPLGSTVELTDGSVAKVIRRPRDGYAIPIVANEDGNRVELERSDVSIAKPIVDPNSEQVRVSQEMMASMDWDPAEPLEL